MMALVTCDYFDGNHPIDVSCMSQARWIVGDSLACDAHLHLFVLDGVVAEEYEGPIYVEIK